MEEQVSADIVVGKYLDRLKSLMMMRRRRRRRKIMIMIMIIIIIMIMMTKVLVTNLASQHIQPDLTSDVIASSAE